MDVLVIGKTKWKITLTAEDFETYGLNGETADANDPKTKTALNRILEAVKARSGIETEGERLLMQLYPSRTGGGELFVTGIGKKTLPAEPKQTERKLFRFSTFTALIGGAKVLESHGYGASGSAWYAEDGTYYLQTDAVSAVPAELSEFTLPVTPWHRIYLTEHASLVIPSPAISALAALG